jgi:hypothetical protein
MNRLGLPHHPGPSTFLAQATPLPFNDNRTKAPLLSVPNHRDWKLALEALKESVFISLLFIAVAYAAYIIRY